MKGRNLITWILFINYEGRDFFDNWSAVMFWPALMLTFNIPITMFFEWITT